jgi:hypothetical protein
VHAEAPPGREPFEPAERFEPFHVTERFEPADPFDQPFDQPFDRTEPLEPVGPVEPAEPIRSVLADVLEAYSWPDRAGAAGPQDAPPQPEEAPFAWSRQPEPPAEDPLAPAYPPAPRRPASQPLSNEDYPRTQDPRAEPAGTAPGWEHPDALSPGDQLMRRVRGAQLPDTGPRPGARSRPTGPPSGLPVGLPVGMAPAAPARNAESVREALARYTAGRRDAEETSG